MRKVYVVNDSGHDYSEAKKYGHLVYLSSGEVNRYAINQMYRGFVNVLKHSSKDDYILATGLTQMNMVAASIFARIHGRLNLLIHHFEVGYVSREIVLDNLLTYIQPMDKDAS